MSVFSGGPYGRLAFMLNTLSSLNIEIIIIIIIIIIIQYYFPDQQQQSPVIIQSRTSHTYVSVNMFKGAVCVGIIHVIRIQLLSEMYAKGAVCVTIAYAYSSDVRRVRSELYAYIHGSVNM